MKTIAKGPMMAKGLEISEELYEPFALFPTATVTTLITMRAIPNKCYLIRFSLYRTQKSKAVINVVILVKDWITAGLTPIYVQR